MGSGLLPFPDAVTVTGPSLYIVHQTFWKRSVQPRLAFKTQIPERMARDYQDPSLVPCRLEAASEIATSAIGGLVADSAS
jgi:hypothetical protein